MKYGVHASESVESIIDRKIKEYMLNQKLYWGYGGVICHPKKQIQPFAFENSVQGKKTYLLLTPTKSDFMNNPNRATMFSTNNSDWEYIPNEINILGSKYSVVCGRLNKIDYWLDLNQYEVAIGNSQRKRLSDYLKGRVDKACGRYKPCKKRKPNLIKIDYYAEIKEPYAVFVK